MKKPFVSVIIPNYNHARYLEERIDSVLSQTYRNFEVIILDDCSTDNSREVINKYKEDNHICKIVFNERNSGNVFQQWNKGLSLVNGELIWIAESDDKCEDDFLETLVCCFLNNKNLALAFCRSICFDDTGNTWTMDVEGLMDGIYKGNEFVTKFMSYCCPMYNASSCLFSRAKFDKIQGLYLTLTAAGDRFFWTEIAEHGDVAVVGKRMNHFRRHEMASTSRTLQAGINQKENKVIMDYILNKGYIDSKSYNQIRKRYLRSFVFELLTDNKLKKDIYDYWGYKWYQQLEFKLEAYKRKIIK